MESFFLYAAEHATLSKQYRPTQTTPDLLKQMRSFLTGECSDSPRTSSLRSGCSFHVLQALLALCCASGWLRPRELKTSRFARLALNLAPLLTESASAALDGDPHASGHDPLQHARAQG